MAKKIRRYSEAFKRQVVAEYEAGSSIAELRKKYGITGGQTVQAWIKKYAKEGLRHDVVRIQQADEIQRIKELEAEVKKLEQALGKVTFEKLALESIVEELVEEDPEAVKKNEPPSSSAVPPKSGDRKGSG